MEASPLTAHGTAPRVTAEAFAAAAGRLLGERAQELFVEVLQQVTERLVAEARASTGRTAFAPAQDLADISRRGLDVLELVAA